MSSYPIEPFSSRLPSSSSKTIDEFFGLANRLMSEMIGRDGFAGSTSFFSETNDGQSNPNVKVFGVSSMNVTQISRGPDGRPRVLQAHDERRMGPGGIWQTKKALRDPDRGIDKMQVGYFVGDQGEIVERHYDPKTRQYREEIIRKGLPAEQWRVQAREAMQRPLPPPPPPQQQQRELPAYDPYALPPPPPPPPTSSIDSYQYY